jgi:hypothetical protein
MCHFCHTAGAVRVSFQHKNVLMLMLERQPDATLPHKSYVGWEGDRHKIWACWPTYVYISNVYFSHRINEERGARYVHKHAAESLRENVRFFVNVSPFAWLLRYCMLHAQIRVPLVCIYVHRLLWIPFSTSMRIRILFLIKGMRICDHWSTGQSIHGSILNLHASILYFEPLQPLNFDFDADPVPPQNADPNPASQNADPNPASKNADPDPASQNADPDPASQNTDPDTPPCSKNHTKDSKYLEKYCKVKRI